MHKQPALEQYNTYICITVNNSITVRKLYFAHGLSFLKKQHIMNHGIGTLAGGILLYSLIVVLTCISVTIQVSLQHPIESDRSAGTCSVDKQWKHTCRSHLFKVRIAMLKVMNYFFKKLVHQAMYCTLHSRPYYIKYQALLLYTLKPEVIPYDPRE